VIVPKCLAILLVFWIAQSLDNYIFQPLIFSRAMKAHPLEIFLIVLIAGVLGGIAAMILAIPAYMVIKIVAKEFFSEYKVIKKLTKDV
jgi:predicted PurR-regulated permease PerM